MIVCINFMGCDFIADIDYRVTSYGCDAQTYGPPENCYPAEPLEWEINSIVLSRDETLSAEQHKLFNALSGLPAVKEAILENICENGPTEPDYRGDEN